MHNVKSSLFLSMKQELLDVANSFTQGCNKVGSLYKHKTSNSQSLSHVISFASSFINTFMWVITTLSFHFILVLMKFIHWSDVSNFWFSNILSILLNLDRLTPHVSPLLTLQPNIKAIRNWHLKLLHLSKNSCSVFLNEMFSSPSNKSCPCDDLPKTLLVVDVMTVSIIFHTTYGEHFLLFWFYISFYFTNADKKRIKKVF